MCGYCYAEVERLSDAPCEENPEVVKGPIGMYHCPDCGVMLVAGCIHPKVCDSCLSYLIKDREMRGKENGNL